MSTPRPLPVTEWAVESLLPSEWLEVADFLHGLLARAPLREGKSWSPQRVALGAFAEELRLNALAAGVEPTPPADLPPEWQSWARRMDARLLNATNPTQS